MDYFKATQIQSNVFNKGENIVTLAELIITMMPLLHSLLDFKIRQLKLKQKKGT